MLWSQPSLTFAPARTAARGIAELETHEVDRRGLLVVLALHVFVGDRVDAPVAFDLDEHAVLHTDEPGQFALALVRVGELDQNGRLPVAAVGHQGCVGIDLALDALFVEDLLDVSISWIWRRIVVSSSNWMLTCSPRRTVRSRRCAMNSGALLLRIFAYASSVNRLSRVMLNRGH